MKLYVARNRGAVDKLGRHYRPGAEVDASDFQDAQSLLDAGYLTKEPQPEAPAAPVLDREAGEGSPPPKFDIDPATLEGKELDELNVMALEIDAELDPFETVVEAIEYLSQDFEAPDAGAQAD